MTPHETANGPHGTATPWWRTAVIYQIYVRSFADADGDGTGDLRGVIDHLDYLRDLGVDALWFTPWYVSPLADGGYDVADYRAIDPRFGSLDDAETLIARAAERDIRTIVDIVPNHVSDHHRWFAQALAAGPGSPERARFWFHPGRGEHGEIIPTAWVSDFQGPTWTRTTNPDGTPGEWYLHLFADQQPDLNWSNPEVRAEFEDILRFWFDRGVAGIRIDSAALPAKDPALPEVPRDPAPGAHPYVDRDDLHDIYRSWRAIADTYPDPRILVGEIWLPDPERFARYLRADEMHTAFNFDFMSRPWDAKELRESIDTTLESHARVGAVATWVLSNHDVTRPVTRYGRTDSSFAFATKRFGTPTDPELGRRRARAAAMLAAALPGSLYVYQGEELGLPEVEDLPGSARQDPMYFRSEGRDPGRDGCRVPLPWTDVPPTFGFSPDDAAAPSWLPQPAGWGEWSAAVQDGREDSMLTHYRRILHLRRDLPAEPLEWVQAPEGVLAFERGATFTCMVNLSGEPVDLPAGRRVFLASAPLVPPADDAPPASTSDGTPLPRPADGGTRAVPPPSDGAATVPGAPRAAMLPPDAAVWLEPES